MVSMCFRSRPTFHLAGDNTESTDGSTDAASPASSYHGYGRIFQRQTTPFIAISTIVVAGIRHETADSGDEATNDVPTFVFYPLLQTASQTDQRSIIHILQHAGDTMLGYTLRYNPKFP